MAWAAHLAGQTQPRQGLKPAGAGGVLQRIAMTWRDQALLVDGGEQAAVQAGQALGLRLAGQPRDDLLVGDRAQIEGHQVLGRSRRPRVR